ncbi:HNH endonuclease [Paeniglutamicibacter cryotolerans]|uniref:5-methylcytosine-specific restriction endonuclease McrA n=1 Tax=Paeniglutamicibacter cryotolerans TaxID=670079 RepID=A0A839QGW6_9MICC|nr:HNH endonuclease [Paeniglutamicibacter cryotolerans]MBB2995419.1 5-methylcytosine-specific restriction endonuclease McrA [Paeniglutamicibacter cryotolerans]
MRTLVLNAGYEPLAVITFRRALLLVLTGKASVLAEDESDPVVGPHSVLSRPTVILLHRYIRLPYRDSAQVSRRGVLRRDGNRCGYCGHAATTVDHITPRSRGGADSWENLVACCQSCNSRKADKTLRQLGWKLVTKPVRPRGAKWFITGLERPAADWSPFLEEEAA